MASHPVHASISPTWPSWYGVRVCVRCSRARCIITPASGHSRHGVAVYRYCSETACHGAALIMPMYHLDQMACVCPTAHHLSPTLQAPIQYSFVAHASVTAQCALSPEARDRTMFRISGHPICSNVPTAVPWHGHVSRYLGLSTG